MRSAQVVAVEQEGDVFFLGEVTSEGIYTLDDGFTGDDGTEYEAGDELIAVHKYEPVQKGGAVWRKTNKQFPVFVEDVRKSDVCAGLKPEGGERRGRMVLDKLMKEAILATLVPVGLEPAPLKKSEAERIMQEGKAAILGHGVEAAFEIDGKAVWEHGQVIDMDADRIRLKYYGDKTKHWHRRFRMDYYGVLAKPTEANEAMRSGVANLSHYYWRLLSHTA